ncbi:MAG: UBP-type zinc finger domain-containing protein [Chloroflexi bacterium]|nr:MAG: UBP-type zinc finger domain-containing protein [Chloroflexota bacterium]TMG71899.1 MAG: UBP-type zinc finger domain-containing protein [Chloroflexota bacterium]
MPPRCSHLDQIREVTPSGDGCDECIRLGDEWVHLRLCMTCGRVGCCDDSKNKHASKHARNDRHPIIRSFEPDEDWGWCFVDEVDLDARAWRVRGPVAHSV